MKTYIRVRFHQRVLPNGKTSLLRETGLSKKYASMIGSGYE